MPDMHVTNRSETRTRAMNIRRARQMNENWEVTFETVISILTIIKDTNLYMSGCVCEFQEDINEIVRDLPNQREWSQPYLFRLCTTPTGNCQVKKNIRRAANGWKTTCEALYVIHNLSKDMVDDDNESIDEFESAILEIFTEDWLYEAQKDANFEFNNCIEGFWGDANNESVATIQAENDSETTDEEPTEGEYETEGETETEYETDDETEYETDDEADGESDGESDGEYDDMPELIDDDDYLVGNYIDLTGNSMIC